MSEVAPNARCAKGRLRSRLLRCNRPTEELTWTPASTPSTSTPASTRWAASRGGWHPLTMATRMTSDRFVGRSAELAELRAALEEAIGSRPSLALVGGESGVGKSRLADELARHAREAGVRVLSGDCVELGDDELPYAPLLTAVRPLVRQGDPSLQALAPQLRSALDAILPGVGGGAAPSTAPQSRVFEALLAVLQLLAEEQPVLLLIEDLHWADSSTRSFIGFLARTMCSERLLIVGTYRSDELHRRHPLRPLLAEAASDPYTRLIELPRFTQDELREQLEGILADPPRPELVERVYARSEGNALYAEEILAAGLDGRGTLPPTLRDALMLRVERLSQNAQDVLQWLACQPAADHALVAAVAGLEPGELRDALREAVASHIVVTVGDDGYGFRHALLREVVYDDLLPGERSEMHAALARAMEDRIEGGDAGAHITAAAAHHWAAAGDQPKALAAAVRAALAAERVNAFGEEQALFERALALWERVPEPERRSPASDQVELLKRAAFASDQAGEPASPGGAAAARVRAGGRRAANPARMRAAARAAEPVALVAAPPGRGDRGAEPRTGAVPRGRSERGARHAAVASREEAHGAGSADRGEGRRRGGARDRARVRQPRGRGPGAQRARDGRWACRATWRPACGCCTRRSTSPRSSAQEMDMGGAWVNIADVLNIGGPHPRGAGGRTPGPRGGVEQPVADRRLAAALDRRVPVLPRRLGRGRGDDSRREPAPQRRHAAAVAGGTRDARAGPRRPGARRGGAVGDGPRRGRDDRAPVRRPLRRDARGARAPATATSTAPARRSTTRSTGSSTARTTWRGSPRRPRPACAWRATPASSRATARTPRPSARSRERADALIERTRLAAESCGPVEEAELATAEAEYARATDAPATRARCGPAPPPPGRGSAVPTPWPTPAGARPRR